jgi:hypothetical protein
LYSSAKALPFDRRARYLFVFSSAVLFSFHAPLTSVFEST